MSRKAERQRAEALQLALERLERLRSRGVEERKARRQASRHLGASERRLFRLGTGLGDVARPMPEAPFADELEARLRREAASRGRVAPMRRRRSRVPVLAAAAACFVLVLGILYGASGSIPGEPLYEVKRAAESVRLGAASGVGEARLRVALADRRLTEVEALREKARGEVIGTPGTVLAAGAVEGIDDPELAALIRDTLGDAEEQMQLAAPVLVQARDSEGLQELADVARKGRDTAHSVGADLPPESRSSAHQNELSFQAIEAQAESAKAGLEPTPTPVPTPGPCATPTPTPTATPTPTPTPEGTPTPTPAPGGTPTPTPEPTPCVSPAPTPTPESEPAVQATPTPAPTPTPTPEPTEGGTETPEPTPWPTPTPTPRAGDGEAMESSGCGWFRSLLVLC